ncbi:MAG: NeuD/PglB/VioB family sugar acetyltransferase, partial [Candidatus Poribacteria bacterium]
LHNHETEKAAMSGTTPEANNRRVPPPSFGDGISDNERPSYSLAASAPFPLRVPPGGPATLHDKRELILLGGGGLARELIGYSEGSLAVEDDYTDAKPIRVIGVLDDGMDEGDYVGGVPVLGKMTDAQRIAEEKPDVRFVLAISAPHTYKYRPQVIQRAGLDRDRYATFLMPGAHLVPSVRIGRGVVLFPGVVIGTNAVIEDHVQIWPNVVVSHDCRLAQYTTLASSVSLNGVVRVGRGAYIGSGALVREGLNIGEDALVGMGAVVLRDVDPGTVVVGNPARYLRDI